LVIVAVHGGRGFKGFDDFGGVNGSSWQSLWCLEVEGVNDFDDIGGSFAFEGCAVFGGWVILMGSAALLMPDTAEH
jgi:hypothetical protein